MVDIESRVIATRLAGLGKYLLVEVFLLSLRRPSLTRLAHGPGRGGLYVVVLVARTVPLDSRCRQSWA